MGENMSKEQEEYIKKIQDDCLERTNMTEEEAYRFAFRCWQLNYSKTNKNPKIDKKYELVESDSKRINGNKTVFRIKALRNFSDVKAGDLGGYVESEDNLSHEGTCWIYGDAIVYDNARILDDAKIFNNARIFNNANVFGHAKVNDTCWVFGTAQVFGSANIFNDSLILDDARVFKEASVNHSIVCKNAKVHGVINLKDAIIGSNASIIFNKDYSIIQFPGCSAITLFRTEDMKVNVSYSDKSFYSLKEFKRMICNGMTLRKIYSKVLDIIALEILTYRDRNHLS